MVLAIGSSCKHNKDGSTAPGGTGTTTGLPENPPAEVVVETVLGRILILGDENAFVIFQLEAGESATDGEELDVRFAGATVGKVKVTPPQKSRMVSADVLSGTVEKGYEVVRQKIEKVPPVTP